MVDEVKFEDQMRYKLIYAMWNLTLSKWNPNKRIILIGYFKFGDQNRRKNLLESK